MLEISAVHMEENFENLLLISSILLLKHKKFFKYMDPTPLG